MSSLAPTLQAFFTDRLVRQRHASPETVAAYRDALRLLVCFASQHVHKQPSQLSIGDLDAGLIGSFLDYFGSRAAELCTHAQCAVGRRSLLFRLMPPSAILNTPRLFSGCSLSLRSVSTER